MFTPDAVTPQQRLRSAHLRGVRQLDRAHVPIYGLPASWNGERCTGNTSFETGVTRDADGVQAELHESVELIHTCGSSRLRVESSDHARAVDDTELLELLGSDGTCSAMTFTVEGNPVAFAAASAVDRFVARWAGYRASVTVIGERWPAATGLELIRITDLAPYHDGRLRMLEQRSGFDLRG